MTRYYYHCPRCVCQDRLKIIDGNDKDYIYYQCENCNCQILTRHPFEAVKE